jgi:hypothetical protein
MARARTADVTFVKLGYQLGRFQVVTAVELRFLIGK